MSSDTNDQKSINIVNNLSDQVDRVPTKGFRRQKDLTRKQLLKQQDTTSSNIKKVWDLAVGVSQATIDLQKRVASIEGQLDVTLPVIQFEYAALVDYLLSKNLISSEELVEFVEKRRVEYLNQREKQTDLSLNLADVTREAQGGDVVVVSYVAVDPADESRATIADMSNTYFMTTVGATTMGFPQLMPNLAAAMFGMKAGDVKKDIEVHFPKDYEFHPKYSEKTLLFTLSMLKVKEVRSPVAQSAS